jgi:hypothetical protein
VRIAQLGAVDLERLSSWSLRLAIALPPRARLAGAVERSGQIRYVVMRFCARCHLTNTLYFERRRETTETIEVCRWPRPRSRGGDDRWSRAGG